MSVANAANLKLIWNRLCLLQDAHYIISLFIFRKYVVHIKQFSYISILKKLWIVVNVFIIHNPHFGMEIIIRKKSLKIIIRKKCLLIT